VKNILLVFILVLFLFADKQIVDNLKIKKAKKKKKKKEKRKKKENKKAIVNTRSLRDIIFLIAHD